MTDIDITDALVAHLKAHVGTAALISGRVYPGKLPEPRVLPAVVYQRQSTPQLHIARYARPTFRLTCWSYTHSQSWQVAEQVRLACECYHGDMGALVHAFSMVEDLRDGVYEPLPMPGIYPVHVYVRVWFQQAPAPT